MHLFSAASHQDINLAQEIAKKQANSRGVLEWKGFDGTSQGLQRMGTSTVQQDSDKIRVARDSAV